MVRGVDANYLFEFYLPPDLFKKRVLLPFVFSGNWIVASGYDVIISFTNGCQVVANGD